MNRTSPYLWQMTEDHSVFNEKVRSGLLREEDRETYEGKNIITRSVGYEATSNCDVFEKEIFQGDAYLLCSDGLHGLVPDCDIASICSCSDNNEVVPKLVAAAKRGGGDDNITCIYIRVKTEG